jgi:hypothetical protein
MRTFEHYPKQSICPICGTNEDKECMLLPIMEEKKEGESCCQAHPFHTDCIFKGLYYYKEKGIIVNAF